MRKLSLLLLLCALCIPSSWAATDYYVAAASSGSGNGASCVNADSITGTFFTTSGNWVQDLTWHLCGAFVGSAGGTFITTLGSGTSGHPITIKFENGANAQAPYWSANGAIRVNHNYIVITGSTNCGVINNVGVECTEYIQDTLNGISGQNICPGGVCTNQQNTTGIYLNGCTGCEVKNLGIFDLYDRVANTTDLNAFGLTVDIVGGNSLHIHNLHCTNSANGPAYVGTGVTASAIEMDHNWVQGTHVGLQVGDGQANSVMNNFNIHDNDISGASIWDATNGASHIHNEGIHLFTNFSGSALNSPMEYNNYFHGANGVFYTAFTFLEFVTTPYVFNNVFVIESGTTPTNGTHGFKACTGGFSYNNTMVMGTGGTGIIIQNSSTNVTVENDLTSGTNSVYANTDPNETGQVWDYNLYWQSVSSSFFYNNAFYNWNTGSSWHTTLGFDVHGQAGNDPKLSGTYTLQAGSAAIAAGTNLFSTCNGQPNPGLGALCLDKAGIARPTSGAWDQGAFQFGTGGTSVGGGVKVSGPVLISNSFVITITGDCTKTCTVKLSCLANCGPSYGVALQ